MDPKHARLMAAHTLNSSDAPLKAILGLEFIPALVECTKYQSGDQPHLRIRILRELYSLVDAFVRKSERPTLSGCVLAIAFM